MGKPTRRLGRGLDSLVSDLSAEATVSRASVGGSLTQEKDIARRLSPSSPTATMLPVADLAKNPFQPRSNIHTQDVLSLAESMRQSGMIQPITVRPAGDRYEIIAGERRWLAAKAIGMSSIPALIRDASDEQMLELALIENIQREDLNAIDRAKAYHHFCSAFGLKAEEIARRLGEDRSTVTNYLRLLELPGAIQGQVADGTLTMGHARCLLGVADERRRQRLAESVVQNQLSVRALEEIVRREKTRRSAESAREPAQEPRPSPHLVDLQQRFEQALKTKVAIHEGKRKGTGRITIKYYSLDDFERIAGLLNVALE